MTTQEIFKYTREHPVYWTSDTHWGHKNIIKYCNRPFSNVEEMNCKLVENWNKMVEEDAIIFHLGDFAFGGTTMWKEIRSALRGRIVLIKGNHDFDKWRPEYDSLFDGVYPQLRLNLHGTSIYMNHFPFLCYPGYYNKENPTIQLFGHVHSMPEHYTNGMKSDNPDIQRLSSLLPTQYDVGVDNNNYTPVSWETIQQIITKQIKNHGIQ